MLRLLKYFSLLGFIVGGTAKASSQTNFDRPTAEEKQNVVYSSHTPSFFRKSEVFEEAKELAITYKASRITIETPEEFEEKLTWQDRVMYQSFKETYSPGTRKRL